MAKYTDLSKAIIENVGGKDNIKGLIHCVTRLRFTLKDESKVNDSILKSMDGIITTLNSGGQQQIVIGNHVPDVYKEVCQQLGMTSDELSSDNSKKGVFNTILDIVQNVFTPILTLLCASGLIRGLNVLAEFIGIYSMDSSFYVLFDSIGNTLFYFFPVFLGYTSAKKFNIKPMLGMAIGAALCYPAINGEDMSFFGYAMNVTYTSTVLPVIFICAFAAPIEKFIYKRLPSSVKSFMTPMLVLAIVVPIGFAIVGPFINHLAYAISDVLSGLYSFNTLIAGFVISSIWLVLVLFGIHAPFMMILIMNIINGTPDPIFAVISAHSFAVMGCVFAIWLKTKDKELKSNALGSWITAFVGISEPSIYGILLPRIKCFVIACMGSGFGGLYLALMNIKGYQMAGMGIFRLPAFFGPGNVQHTIIHVLIGYTIAFSFAGIVTFMVYKDDEKELSEEKDENIYAPLRGEMINIEDVEDTAFSSKTLGDGIAIIPSEGKVFAPFHGIVTTLFPTLHAVCFKSDSGCELLVHVGFDTVNLNGECFKSYVKQGDRVKKGQLVLEFDKDKMMDKGYSITTPAVITNTNEFKKIEKEVLKVVTEENQILKGRKYGEV